MKASEKLEITENKNLNRNLFSTNLVTVGQTLGLAFHKYNLYNSLIRIQEFLVAIA